MSFCYQVRGSLARRALSELAGKGLIKQVSAHRSQIIYTRVTKDNEEEPEGGVVVEKPKKGGGNYSNDIANGNSNANNPNQKGLASSLPSRKTIVTNQSSVNNTNTNSSSMAGTTSASSSSIIDIHC